MPDEQTPSPAQPPQPLLIQQELSRAWGVLCLQTQRMYQVANSVPDALEVAVVFLITGTVLSYIGGILYPFQLGGREWELSHVSRIATVLVQLGLTIGIIAWMAFLARVFRAPVRFDQLFRVLGYAGIVFLLLIFPSLTLLVFSWWFAVAFVALRGLGQLDSERALLVVLSGVILLFVCSRLFAMLGLYLWFGRWSLIAFL